MKKSTFLCSLLLCFSLTISAQDIAPLGSSAQQINTEKELLQNVEFTESLVSAGTANRAPCSESNPSNAFENAVFSSDGATAPLQVIAADATVAADEDFTLNTVNANLWAALGGADVASADIVIYGDAGGIADPGNIIDTQTGVVPTSQTLLGQNGAGTFDVYDVEFDMGGVVLGGQPGVSTTYWVSIYMTMGDGGDGLWELSTASVVGNELGFSLDGGATWAVFAGNECVYTFSGDCGPIGGGGDCTTYDSPNVPFDIDGAGDVTVDCAGAPNDIDVNVPDAGTIGLDTSIDNVTIDIAHTWSGDLTISLVSPGGVELILADALSGNTDDAYNGTMFQDGGADITAATAPFGVGPYAPEGGDFATAFDGEDINGDWSLRICDGASGDTGTVNSFSLTLCEIPTNDDCSDAFPIACGDIVTGETINDTDSGANPANDEFYSFTGSGSPQIVTLSLCDGGTDYDSFLRVFEDCTLANELFANDDACGLQSELTFLSDGTSTYYIMIEGFGSASGNYSLEVSCVDPEPNDTCDGAIDIACGEIAAGSTINASVDTDVAPDCDTSVTANGVWYRYEDTTGLVTDITITMCNGTTDYDAKLSVYTGDCGAPPLTCVVGNDDTCGLQSEVSFQSDGNTTFLILVHGFGGSTGNFEIEMTCVPVPPPNDMIANSIDVDEIGVPYTDPAVPMPAATTEAGNPTGCNIDGANGVWYNFVAEGTGQAWAEVISPAGLTSVTFYTAPNETATEADLTLVPGGQNQCLPGEMALINTVQGQAYYVFVVNTDGITDIVIDGENLGVGDNVIAGFSYYPNPAKNVLNLNSIELIESVEIYNILGQQVIGQTIDATDVRLDVSGLQTGTYIMKASVNGQIGTYKIIKE